MHFFAKYLYQKVYEIKPIIQRKVNIKQKIIASLPNDIRKLTDASSQQKIYCHDYLNITNFYFIKYRGTLLLYWFDTWPTWFNTKSAKNVKSHTQFEKTKQYFINENKFTE